MQSCVKVKPILINLIISEPTAVDVALFPWYQQARYDKEKSRL